MNEKAGMELKPLDMEGEGIADAHVSGIDLDYRASDLDAEFAEALPKPILEANPDWIDLYWRCWAIAVDRVRKPDPKTGLKPFCDAAFSENMFQWDTCFLIGFARYAAHVLPVENTLENFYKKQHDDGFICREINSVSGKDFWDVDHPSAVNPPLFADAEWRLFQITGNTERLRTSLGPLIAYYEWLAANRKHADGTGYWTTALASGMDNTPRTLPYGDDAHDHFGFVWMCLTAQQGLAAKRIHQIAKIVGNAEATARFAEEHEKLADYCEREFWHPDLGFYVDRDSEGALTEVLTPAASWVPLLGKTTSERFGQLVEAYLDPELFWRPHALPSVSANHPSYHGGGNYWQGSVWPPLTMVTIKAMMANGRHDIASKIAENHIANIAEVQRKNGTVWENYASEKAARGNISRPEFVGWTGCGPIEALIENVIGITPDASDMSIDWHSYRDDRHGIEDLTFDGAKCSLEYDPSRRLLKLETNKAITVHFHRGDQSRRIEAEAGLTQIEL